MISKLPHILTIFTGSCLTLLAQDGYAQDGYPHNNFQEPSYQELNLNEDKPLIYELNESRPSRTTVSIQRDSLAAVTAKAKATKKAAAEKKEGDALSFNFLYYIIQKYKASDIVDQ